MSFPNVYLCRLCLCSGGRLIDIFNYNDFLEFVIQDVVEELLHIQVKRKVGFPWLICSSCLGKLTEFRFFKIRCLECKVTFESRFPDWENSTRVFLESDTSGVSSSPCDWYNGSPACFLKEDIKQEESEEASESLDEQGGGGGSLAGNCGSEPVFVKSEPENNESEDGQHVGGMLEAELGGNSHAAAAQENWQGSTQMASNGVSYQTVPNGVPSHMASDGFLYQTASDGFQSQTCSQQGLGSGTGCSRRGGRGKGRRTTAGKRCGGHSMDVGLTRCDICDEHSDKGCCGVNQGSEDAGADSEDDEVWLSGPKRKRAALQRWYWELEKLRTKAEESRARIESDPKPRLYGPRRIPKDETPPLQPIEQAKSDGENAAVASLPRDEPQRKVNSHPQDKNSDSAVEGQWCGGMPKIVNVLSTTTTKPFRGRGRKMGGPGTVVSSLGPPVILATADPKDKHGCGIAIRDGIGKIINAGGVLKGVGGRGMQAADGTSVGGLILEFSESLKRKVKQAMTDEESTSFPRLVSKSAVSTVPVQGLRSKEVGMMRKVEGKSVGKETKGVVMVSGEERGSVPMTLGNPSGERVLAAMKRSKGDGVKETEYKISSGVSKVLADSPHKLVRISMGANQSAGPSLSEAMKAVNGSESGPSGGEIKTLASVSRDDHVGGTASLNDRVSCPPVSLIREERAGFSKKSEVGSTVKGEVIEFAPVSREDDEGPSVISSGDNNTGVHPHLAIKSSVSDPPADNSENSSAAVEREELSVISVTDDDSPSTNALASAGASCSQLSVGESMVEAVKKVDVELVLVKSERLAHTDDGDLPGISCDSSQIESGDRVVEAEGDMLSVEQTEGLATVLLENKVGAGSSLDIGSVAGGDAKPSSSASIREDAGDGSTPVIVASEKCVKEIKVNHSLSHERVFLSEGCDRSADASGGSEEVGSEAVEREPVAKKVHLPRTKSGRFCKRHKGYRGWNLVKAIGEAPQDAEDKGT